MLDFNLEFNNKLVLLKQVKIILESLMFDNLSFSARSSWQNFSGTMTIFARHILAVIEDGLYVSDLSNSPVTSLLSCSPIEQRSFTVSSGSNTNSRASSNATTTRNIELLWLFITNSLILSDEPNDNIYLSPEDRSAKKDFTSFYVQLSDNDQIAATRKLSTVSSKSILSISDQCNLPLEWIIYSLRQNILLNQLKYLVRDEKQMRCYYKASAFLLDKSFAEDFFNYIKAYELRDYSILSKVKRNFFSIEPQTDSFNGPMSRSPQQIFTGPDTQTDKNISVSPSLFNSINAPQSSPKLSNMPQALDQTSSLNYSIVENAIKEVNHLTLKRNTASHRRMLSVPNIQINMAKRDSMAVSSSGIIKGINQSEGPSSVDDSSYFEQSFGSTLYHLNAAELKTIGQSSTELESPLVTDEIKPKSSSLLSNASLIPVLNLNDQLLDSSRTNIFESSPPGSPPISTNDDIYQQTSVFAFIHSQQINLECSQLDKENSHFIIADISIAAFELIKTQDLDNDSTPTSRGQELIETSVNKNKTNNLFPRSAKYPVSNQIKINRPSKTGQLRNFDSPSDTNSPNTTSNFDFAATSMACSMDHETIYNSGFTSPNPDMQSMCSGAVTARDLEATPTKMLSRAQSVVSLMQEKEELNERRVTILHKSLSSGDFQGTTEEIGNERLFSIREKWLMAARKTVINQNAAKNCFAARTEEDDNKIAQDCQSRFTARKNSNEAEDNVSIGTQASDTSLDNKTKPRGRRFSWEEIINLDTAENISTRLIERLIDTKKTLLRKKTKLLTRSNVSIPDLRQLEHAIQKMEYYEYMQTYYELRSSSLLEKYLVEALKKASSNKPINNSIKLRPTNTISKIKTAAVAAAAAVSIEQMQAKQLKEQKVYHSVIDALTLRLNSLDKEQGKKNLIRQISVNINSIDPSGTTSPKTAAFSLLRSNQLNENENCRISSILSGSSVSNTSFFKRDSVSSLHKTLNARIIGDENWAPVRDQLILNQTPKQKRLDQMIQQRFRCADCGIQVHKDKIKSFNYCEYYAKYFCRCCHINNQSYIPAYVIYLNDYRTKYEVSKKAKNFLEKIYNEPVITLESLNSQLFERNSVFTKIKKLRLRLYSCRGYINSCRFATDLRKHLYTHFDDFIVNDQHVYSIETLFKIKKTNYSDELKLLVGKIMDHIKQCELCSQQGYICGMCTNSELLYPFDLDKIEKCVNCLSCYHRSCFKKPEQCPRCRRKRTRIQSSTSGGMPSITST